MLEKIIKKRIKYCEDILNLNNLSENEKKSIKFKLRQWKKFKKI